MDQNNKFTPKEGSGAAFLNQYKDQSPNGADYTGKIRMNGQDMRLRIWKKSSKDGTKDYLSVSVTPLSEPKTQNYPSQSPNSRAQQYQQQRPPYQGQRPQGQRPDQAKDQDWTF